MGSAKTMRLLTTAYNFEERNIKFKVYKPKVDNRDGDDRIFTRAGLERECKSINEYFDFSDAILDNVQFILIDECQFLTEQQVDKLAHIVDTFNINVFCYGLRTDFQTKLFSGSKRLFEIADDFEEVPSMCSCGRKTSVNARFSDKGEIIRNGEQVLIGGNETYKAICRNCYNKDKYRKNG